MNEELKQKIEALYRELLELPRAVTEIFNDFYGEERVDLQPISLGDFIDLLETNNMYEIIGSDPSNLGNTQYYRGHPNAELLNTFRRTASRLSLVTSEDIFDRHVNYMKEFIGNRWFIDIPIIVHFPHVTIRNEYDRTVEVDNLWAKVPVTWEGKGKGWFKMNRSEYDVVHMQSDYMHSHVSGIDFDFKFRSVCTGSGPINNTMSSLTVGFDEPIWQLFCLELERYMGTESLTGGPYRRMENIGANGSNMRDNFSMEQASYVSNNHFSMETSNEFLDYLLASNVLKFNYRNGSYGLAHTFADTVLTISNAFIDWYNAKYRTTYNIPAIEDLRGDGIIKEAIIANGAIYDPNSNASRDYSQYVGRKVLTFKGHDVNLVINGLANGARNVSTILNLDIIREYVWAILELLNCEYGNSKKAKSGIDKKKTRFTL
jgi:hypothetical protein